FLTCVSCLSFISDTALSDIYTLSLHDALPILRIGEFNTLEILRETSVGIFLGDESGNDVLLPNKYVPKEFEIGQSITVFCYLDQDRKSTRLNSSHVKISYAVFCLKKKKLIYDQ